MVKGRLRLSKCKLEFFRAFQNYGAVSAYNVFIVSCMLPFKIALLCVFLRLVTLCMRITEVLLK